MYFGLSRQSKHSRDIAAILKAKKNEPDLEIEGNTSQQFLKSCEVKISSIGFLKNYISPRVTVIIVSMHTIIHYDINAFTMSMKVHPKNHAGVCVLWAILFTSCLGAERLELPTSTARPLRPIHPDCNTFATPDGLKQKKRLPDFKGGVLRFRQHTVILRIFA
jgi:hypothetical protein